MDKKGFTLIELLAVIVVLAVIALIATPMVLNTIEEARKGAAKASASNYIDAIEKKVALGQIKNEKYENKDDYNYNEISVDMKGTTPTGGIYSLENGIVTAGVFCINGYKVNYSKNEITVGEKCTGEEMKIPGVIELSSSNGVYTYPNTGTFEVSTNTSGGELTCTSSDENVATCSIEGTTVTVTPGTKEGEATLTIKSAATDKHTETQVAHVAITSKGNLQSYTANGYEGTYDGETHGITVTCSGATITYGEQEGTYNLTSSPTYISAGTYTVYYKIEKEGYQTITGSDTVKITSLSSNNVSYTNNSVSNITTVGEALDYINGKLK